MMKIYYLENKGNIFYIGKTKNSLSLRVGKHREKFKLENIKINLLDEVRDEDWKFWECYWIEQFRQWGFKLKNQNKGGGGPIKHNPKTLLKMSNSMMGKSHSQETKNKMSLSHKGKNFSSLTIKRMSQAKKGICWHPPHSNETKLKISKSKIGNQYKKGKKISKEAKQKMSIAKKGNKYALGYKHTEDQKNKMRKPKNHGEKISKIRSIPIIQYDLNGNFIKEWPSAKKAQETLNLSNGISACCKGKIKTSGKFVWKYK